ncbi:MAG: hypothetical protein D6743_15315 [Calditrichaeota bacterium]|nr:MAG: hypothetical protein D6743_15315 [Calditrichota bacterium]
MTEETIFSELEKSFENFNSRMRGVEKAYDRLQQQLDGYRDGETIPRDYLKEMAANLAHEIRNPLGGIANYVELLADSPASQQSGNIRGILEGIQRIDRVVENLIVFSRPIVLQPIRCNLADLVRRAVEAVRQEGPTDASRCEFLLRLPKEVFLTLDPFLMLQAIKNVLQNAVEFMPAPGRLTVALVVNPKRNKVILYVADEGQEVFEAGDEEKPFYPFFTTKTSGMGLGLPTARLIVEKHGGKIWLKKKAKKGVVVILNLPAARRGDR